LTPTKVKVHAMTCSDGWCIWSKGWEAPRFIV